MLRGFLLLGIDVRSLAGLGTSTRAPTGRSDDVVGVQASATKFAVVPSLAVVHLYCSSPKFVSGRQQQQCHC